MYGVSLDPLVAIKVSNFKLTIIFLNPSYLEYRASLDSWSDKTCSFCNGPWDIQYVCRTCNERFCLLCHFRHNYTPRFSLHIIDSIRQISGIKETGSTEESWFCCHWWWIPATRGPHDIITHKGVRLTVWVKYFFIQLKLKEHLISSVWFSHLYIYEDVRMVHLGKKVWRNLFYLVTYIIITITPVYSGIYKTRKIIDTILSARLIIVRTTYYLAGTI